MFNFDVAPSFKEGHSSWDDDCPGMAIVLKMSIIKARAMVTILRVVTIQRTANVLVMPFGPQLIY